MVRSTSRPAGPAPSPATPPDSTAYPPPFGGTIVCGPRNAVTGRATGVEAPTGGLTATHGVAVDSLRARSRSGGAVVRISAAKLAALAISVMLIDPASGTAGIAVPGAAHVAAPASALRSEEHTSELQS